MCMFGCVFVYALRVNLSVAIVCMVKEPVTNTTSTVNVTTASPDHEGCDRLRSTTTDRQQVISQRFRSLSVNHGMY